MPEARKRQMNTAIKLAILFLAFYALITQQVLANGWLRRFDGIVSNWTGSYTTGIKTDSEKPLQIISYCSITEDKANLAKFLYVQITIIDKNTGLEVLVSDSYSFEKWNKKGINLGYFDKNDNKEIILFFLTNELPKSKQGQSSHFDLEFGILE